MVNNKIKIFLGGYVNCQNAQNNNCRSLSEHLDKTKFDVWTMISWHGYPKDNDFKRTEGVHYLYNTPSPWTEKLHLPYWLFAWIIYAIGIIRCDVAFLPKGEYVRFCHFVARLSGCKLFTTLEGILPDECFAVRPQLNKEKYLNDFRRFKHFYAITKYIALREGPEKNFTFEDKTLYLGVEAEKFLYVDGVHKKLSDIVFIGFNTIGKRVFEFVRMSQDFPQLRFHVVGGNQLEGGVTIEEYLKTNNIDNCVCHGPLDHSHLSELLKKMDLMFFPSRSEGFPKVMLETACAGVPTLCYSDYGADEWITSGVDGYVVDTYEQAMDVIQHLMDNPEKLQKLSDAALGLGKRFDWKVLVKDWENEIEKIAKGE